ncbi:MAG: EAL domain-containing protein [Gammaproteobacteria bacterium]|nr:EAL domain-containing protein [Gammaproteobacteria bacterium]
MQTPDGTGNGSNLAISLGFGAILLLMSGIIAVGYFRLNALNTEIDKISTLYHLKSDIIHKIHFNISERSNSVLYIPPPSQPEIQNELQQDFEQFNQQLSLLQSQFAAMPLVTNERVLFEQAMQLMHENAQLEDRIAQTLLKGEPLTEAGQLIEADRRQEQMLFQKLDDLIALENNLSRMGIDSASASYSDTMKLLSTLGGTVLFISLLITFLVVRRASSFEKKLIQQKLQAEITLHAIGDAVITTTPSSQINYINPIAEKLIGISAQEALHKPFSSVARILDDKRNAVDLNTQLNAFNNEKLKLNDASLLLGEDKEIAVEGSGSLIYDDNGNIIGKVLIFRDVSENRSLSDMLSWQATHDPLTGLVNRREFERLLSSQLDDAKSCRRQHAMLYVDLDQFKVVNDTCGHIAGDMLLQQLTSILQGKIRSSDVIARLGGDEFGVLLESCNMDKAKTIATEILEAIQEYRFSWKNHVFKVGASIGAVPVDKNSESVVKIMSNADSACYVAKDKGRNRIWVHRIDDREIIQRHGEMALTTLITQALEEGKFCIFKQKILSMPGNDAPDMYELLIRMERQNGGHLLPMAFIPAAERYTIMPSIDRWMITASFSVLRDHQELLTPHDMVSINLSGQSLSQNKFLEFVVNELDRFQIEPERICFEITETAAIANWPLVTRFISVLRGMGCKFALDDFGSGMSSFTYLRNFNVDFLKIDGSFVRNIANDNINREVVKAINSLGKTMNIKTIAEYVESDEIRSILEEIGIDYMQGYSIHMPEPL